MSIPFPLPDSIFYSLRASHPREVFRQIAHELETNCGLRAEPAIELLMASEAAGGSAIGDGVAVISCRAPTTLVLNRVCAFARLVKPVAFKGVETHPCDLVYVLISPEDEAQKHLRDLSTIIRAFRDHDFTARLRAETASERLMNLFKARDGALRAAA
ncbi:MAG: PTS sugar transporter subunit IIA [Alphaproteobacteria bacterium]|nr:PTS sugar transporter subunit IIA [Alphaproteobacteria bacterium]